MGLEFETADEGGDGNVGFWGRSAVGSPSLLQRRGDQRDFIGGIGEVGDNRPGISVLWQQSCGLVVAIESCCFVPEKGIGCGFDGCGLCCPC